MWNIIPLKKLADKSIYASKPSHTHTHTQARAHSIDHWNNNKAFIIDPLVLFVYEIHATMSNQGHYSIAQKHTAAALCLAENTTQVINKSTFSTKRVERFSACVASVYTSGMRLSLKIHF